MSFIIIIVSPISGSEVVLGSPIEVVASVSNPIEKVEFFSFFLKFGERVSEPYTFPFTPSTTGPIELRVIGTDSDGVRIPSAAVVIVSNT